MPQIHYDNFIYSYIYLGLYNVQSTSTHTIFLKRKASQEYKLTLNFCSLNNDSFKMGKETMPIVL